MHGWLNLNKPEGMSSAKAVSIAKRLLKAKKVGHTGTLDPLACGVLPLAVGEATKLAQYVVSERKDYGFTVYWGSATSTDDAEGEIIAQSDIRPSQADIEAILPEFLGKIMQRPPDFSAIRIKGERAYKTAREGKKVDIQARPVNIYSLIIEEHSPDKTTFIVECGKGTYVRSLARDMGEKLGCYGHVRFLQRRSVGIFSLQDAVSLDISSEGEYALPPDFNLMSLDAPLDDILALQFKSDQLHRLKQGQAAAPLNSLRGFREAKLVRCYDAISGKFTALGRPAGSVIKPVRVFNIN